MLRPPSLSRSSASQLRSLVAVVRGRALPGSCLACGLPARLACGLRFVVDLLHDAGFAFLALAAVVGVGEGVDLPPVVGPMYPGNSGGGVVGGGGDRWRVVASYSPACRPRSRTPSPWGGLPWAHMGWSVPKAFGYRVVRLCSEMGWSRSLVFGYGVVFPCSHMGWSVPKAVGYGVVRTANDQYLCRPSKPQVPLGRTTVEPITALCRYNRRARSAVEVRIEPL